MKKIKIKWEKKIKKEIKKEIIDTEYNDIKIEALAQIKDDLKKRIVEKTHKIQDLKNKLILTKITEWSYKIKLFFFNLIII